MNNSARTCIIVMATVLSACAPSGNPAPEVAAVPAEVVPVAEPAPAMAATDTPAKLWFEPAALSVCGKADKVVINWDATAVEGLKTVEVKLPGKDGAERLFARAGLTGSKETGMWMIAGREVILRNAAGGSEIARTAIGSLPCDH